jgi:hypothetical protein
MAVAPELHFIDVLNLVAFSTPTHCLSFSDLYLGGRFVCTQFLFISETKIPSLQKTVELCRDYLFLYFIAKKEEKTGRVCVGFDPQISLHYKTLLQTLDALDVPEKSKCFIPPKIKALFSDLVNCPERKSTFESIFSQLKVKCWHCENRDRTKIKRCSKCKLAYYCNQNCQAADRSKHRIECTNQYLLISKRIL